MFAMTSIEAPAATPAPAIPTGLNQGLMGWMALVLLVQLFVLPLWLLPLDAHWGWILVPLALFNPMLWGLLHEAIHGSLLPDKGMNERGGRMLGIAWGASFHVLTYGHLMHHRLNRRWESEYYHPARISRGRAVLSYYVMLLGGLYATEVLASVVFAFAPRKVAQDIIRCKAKDDAQQIAAERYFLKPDRQRRLQQDVIAMVLLYGASLLVYGEYWPLLLAAVYARALVASLLDNIYHYGTPNDNSVAAKEVYAPRLISLLFLHMNYHHTHHRNAVVPWLYLPHWFVQKQGIFTESLWVAFGRQCRGPVAIG